MQDLEFIKDYIKFRQDYIEKDTRKETLDSVKFYQHCVYVNTLVNKNSCEIFKKMLEFKPFATEVAEWRTIGEQYILFKNEIENIERKPETFVFNVDRNQKYFWKAKEVFLYCWLNLELHYPYLDLDGIPLDVDEETKKSLEESNKRKEEEKNKIIKSIVEKYGEEVANSIFKFLNYEIDGQYLLGCKITIHKRLFEGIYTKTKMDESLYRILFLYIDPFGLEEGIKEGAIDIYKECLSLHYSLLYNNK